MLDAVESGGANPVFSHPVFFASEMVEKSNETTTKNELTLTRFDMI